MARTTVTALKEVLTTQLQTNELQAFINDADLWVTEELANATPAISAARLEIIARYLACAFITIRELLLASASIGDVREVYQTDVKVSDYLWRAASLDPTGKVRARFIEQKPGVKFGVGTRFTDEQPKAPWWPWPAPGF